VSNTTRPALGGDKKNTKRKINKQKRKKDNKIISRG
jgi:hypothetical protein